MHMQADIINSRNTIINRRIDTVVNSGVKRFIGENKILGLSIFNDT